MSANDGNSGVLLRMEGIHKWFGKVHALKGVDFEVKKAKSSAWLEIMALGNPH